MQLIFNDLNELRTMIAAMGYIKPDVMSIELPTNTLERMVGTLQPPPEVAADEPVAIDAHGNAPLAALEPVPEEPAVRRKRRTKAEIEADKAAEAARESGVVLEHITSPQGQREFEQADTPAPSPLDNLKSEADTKIEQLAANVDALDAIRAQVGLFEADKMAQLNEGREFIAKHGFAKYSETMQLAGVPANIAGHTPEQVSMHRSAMAWLGAQG